MISDDKFTPLRVCLYVCVDAQICVQTNVSKCAIKLIHEHDDELIRRASDEPIIIPSSNSALYTSHSPFLFLFEGLECAIVGQRAGSFTQTTSTYKRSCEPAASDGESERARVRERREEADSGP